MRLIGKGLLEAVGYVKREELRSLLDSEQVNPIYYNLDGRLENEAYILEPPGTAWTVYYSERGLRSSESQFATEDEACLHLLDLILRDGATRFR